MTAHSIFSKNIGRTFNCLMTMTIIACALTTARADDSLTIQAAVESVLARHPQITQANEAIASVKSRIRQLKSPLYPTVSGDMSYNYWGPNDPLNFGGKSFNLAPTNMVDAHVDASYTIYDFGKRDLTIESGNVSRESAQEKLRATQQALTYQVVQLFHMIILLDKSIQVKDEEMASLDSHLSVVKKKVAAGVATDFDILKTKIQITANLTQRVDLVNDRSKKQTLLRQLLGFPDSAPLVLKGSIEYKGDEPAPDSLVGYAYSNRSDIAILRHNEELAELQIKSAQKDNLPSIGCRALVGLKNGILPNIYDIRFNWSAGAQITVPIYDGNKATSHVSEAEHSYRAALADISAAQERIRTEVLQALSDVTAANDKIALSATQEDLTGKCLTVAQAQYDAGVITNVDVLDAERDYAEAKIAHLQNQFVFTLNRYLLDQAIGKTLRN